LQQLLAVDLDLLPADGQDFVDAVVAHDLAHHRFVHVTERRRISPPGSAVEVPDLEQILVGVLHLVLHDPLDDRNVEVASQHQRFELGHIVLLELGLHA
jgi:predicted SprT family Zn-dependent metalloprotease